MNWSDSIFGSSYQIPTQIYPYYAYQFISQLPCPITPGMRQFTFYTKPNP